MPGSPPGPRKTRPAGSPTSPRNTKGPAIARGALSYDAHPSLRGAGRNRTDDGRFAVSCLTTWPRRRTAKVSRSPPPTQGKPPLLSVLFLRGRTTNDMGRLTLLFPDGGGQYRVVVKAIGFAPCAIHGIRQADEDRFVVNATLSTSTTTLCMVTIRGAQNNAGQAPAAPTRTRSRATSLHRRRRCSPFSVRCLSRHWNSTRNRCAKRRSSSPRNSGPCSRNTFAIR